MTNDLPPGEMPPIPKNLDAELSVIGSILIDNGCFDLVDEILEDRDFFKGEHRKIYHSIKTLIMDGKAADLITVSNLTGDEFLPVIASAAKNTPSSTNASDYAQIVAREATARRMMTFGRDVTEISQNSQISVEDRLNQIEKMAEGLRRIDTSQIIRAAECVSDVVEHMETIKNSAGEFYGLPTGFSNIDNRWKGLQGGNLVVIAARPSMGKSALSQNIIENIALDQKRPALLFSLEMSREEIIKRFIASRGEIPLPLILSGEALDTHHKALFEAAEEVARADILIDDSYGLTISQLRSRARAAKRKYKDLACIVVDYLQLVVEENRSHSRQEHISNVSRNLKLMAKELDIPVIALAQLSRAIENRSDKRPQLSDLRDSGAIEQDADIVAFLYRDEFYNPESEEKKICHVITRKFRNGSVGDDLLRHKLWAMKFENYDQEGSSEIKDSGLHGVERPCD